MFLISSEICALNRLSVCLHLMEHLFVAISPFSKALHANILDFSCKQLNSVRCNFRILFNTFPRSVESPNISVKNQTMLFVHHIIRFRVLLHQRLHFLGITMLQLASLLQELDMFLGRIAYVLHMCTHCFEAIPQICSETHTHSTFVAQSRVPESHFEPVCRVTEGYCRCSLRCFTLAKIRFLIIRNAAEYITIEELIACFNRTS